MLVLVFSTSVVMSSVPFRFHFPHLQCGTQCCTYLIRVVMTITQDGCSKSSVNAGCHQNQVGLIPGKQR